MAFSLIGGFTDMDFWIFTTAMMLGLALVIVLILDLGRMIAQLNYRLASILHVFYTQQLNVVANYMTIGGAETPLWQSFAYSMGKCCCVGCFVCDCVC